MDKHTIKLFIAWLETASEGELQKRRQEILDARKLISTQEGRESIKLALRLLDEEVLARLELQAAKRA